MPGKQLVAALALFSALSRATELPVYRLTLQDHLFFPSQLLVPAGVKFKLLIANKDRSSEEFDSFDLNREKVIFAGSEAVIYVGPLREGSYEFFGEYHPATARGVLKAMNELPVQTGPHDHGPEQPNAD